MAEKKEDQKEKKEIEIPENLKNIVKEIEELKVVDLAKLVKVLEEKFDISAQAPMMAAPVAAGAASAGAAAEEEKTAFDLVLKNPGASKIAVIKIVKEITGKGLKEAKDLVDASEKEPQTLMQGAKRKRQKRQRKT